MKMRVIFTLDLIGSANRRYIEYFMIGQTNNIISELKKG